MPPTQSFQEQIAQKRADAAQKEREQKSDAVLAGIATSDNIDDVLKQLKELQLASLLGGGNKSTVILTDQTDLGDKIAEALSSLDTSKADADQLGAIKELSSLLKSTQKAQVNGNSAIREALTLIEKAVKSIEVAPVVNVPEPKVTVKQTKVDFTPLQDTIREVFATTDEKIDLDDYKAQDIDNSVADMQYIGFVNPEGNWYIIENDVLGNKLRYVFGESGYAEAFAKASTYEYNLLNEAIDALSA